MSKKKILLIGWDAADWKAINTLMDKGHMPTLNNMVNNGSMGNLATLDPPLSPTLWTSISTGKRPYKHGILDFTEPDPTGTSIRPVHITSRKVRAIWNILSHQGYKCHQVGWWPSHPAEPINGISVSNFYQRANNPITEPWPMMEGTIHPKAKEDIFKALRLHPQEITDTQLHPFLANPHLINQNNPSDQKKIHAMTKILAECVNIHSAATYILKNEEWDFMAVYYDAIDHFGHGFMEYNPPRSKHIPEEEYEKWKYAVSGMYKFHDMMLETLMSLATEDTTVILVSNHGFYPNHLRPKVISQEPAGPAFEHSPDGIIVAQGPNIKKDEIIYGASLLDITPTILAMLDKPIGKDMDGKVLNTMFIKKKQINTIESWDKIDGDFLMHPVDIKEDTESLKATLQQLVELEYIAAPGANEEENIKRVINDSKWYKARSYIDGGIYSEAVPLLEELHRVLPEKAHISHLLAHCYIQLKKTGKARKIVQNLRNHQKENAITLLVLQARVLIQEKNPEKALSYINDAIAIQKDYPGLFYYKGKIYQMLGDNDQAMKSYQEAIDHDPENRMALHAIGRIFYEQGEYLKSVEYLLDSIGLQYYAPIVHYDLGLSMEALEDYTAAAEAYRNCIHMMRNHEKAKKRLMKLYNEKLNKPQLAAKIQASLPDYDLPLITIVSGLPRSGTSMMMQMLEAGGMQTFSDGLRIADKNNQKGYYEHERIKYLPKDQSILKKVGDQAVKIVAPLLFHLPANYRYKIIFIERELGEVLLSQHKMLKRYKLKKKSEVFSFKLWQKSEDVIKRVKSTFQNLPNVEFLWIQHRDVIEDPMSVAIEVCVFLDQDMDLNRMATIVDPSLYRERESISEKPS